MYTYELCGLEHVVVVSHGADGAVDDVRLLECVGLHHHGVGLRVGPEGLLLDLLEHRALAGAHPAAHQQQHRAALRVRHGGHHVRHRRLAAARRRDDADRLHLLHQRRDHTRHLQLTRHALETLLPVRRRCTSINRSVACSVYTACM